ncbi:MAG TPA: FecR domain-containing protein [Polyangiaceae bacterium]|nr:FecR domain-containing protein [Polyangiaceae bacterium]
MTEPELVERELLQRLGRRVAATQDAWLTRAVPLDAARDGFLLRRGEKRKASAHRIWWVAAAAALALIPSGYWARQAWFQPGPVAAFVHDKPVLQDSWIDASSQQPVPIHFSDGSDMVLAPGARLRVAELHPDGARVAVETGAVDVHVVHRTRTDYRLNLGPFLVRVTGTRFAVSFSPEQDVLRLKMQEGSVTVSGCSLGEARPVRAGESLVASCKDARFEISRGAAGSTRDAQVPAEAGPLGAVVPEGSANVGSSAGSEELNGPPSNAANGPPVRSGPSWQALAKKGKYAAALGLLEQLGFEAQCERVGSDELTLMADVARFGKRSDRAVLALQALRRRFSGSGAASVAAFSLARIHFDQRAAYDEAARWFRTYLKEQPGGSLAREAQGRLMEALYRGGDRAGAERAAEAYLARNPEGPHARLARSLLGR